MLGHRCIHTFRCAITNDQLGTWKNTTKQCSDWNIVWWCIRTRVHHQTMFQYKRRTILGGAPTCCHLVVLLWTTNKGNGSVRISGQNTNCRRKKMSTLTFPIVYWTELTAFTYLNSHSIHRNKHYFAIGDQSIWKFHHLPGWLLALALSNASTTTKRERRSNRGGSETALRCNESRAVCSPPERTFFMSYAWTLISDGQARVQLIHGQYDQIDIWYGPCTCKLQATDLLLQTCSLQCQKFYESM